MVGINKNLLFKPRSKRLAKIISIKTPGQFQKSITELKKRGLTMKEKKGLVLARTRAKVQLKRKNLSTRERNQFMAISKMTIPRVKVK